MQQFKRSYKELLRLPTFKERYEYLRLQGKVGKETFGFDRYMNQALYTSSEWKRFRNQIIIRDNGCDLADPDRPIKGDRIIIHHINPLTIEDLEKRSDLIFDPNNVVCTSYNTHQAIHFSDESLLPLDPIERRPGDTCPWK
jgi:hypothetical protein